MRYPHFSEIAESNWALLEKLNFTSGTDDPFMLDNPASMRASGLFPDVAINRMSQQLGATPESITEAASKLDVPSSVGMILIRPDMLQIAPAIEQFIARRYELFEVSDIRVTPEQYWTMYEHVIVSKERIYSRLTRAAVYLSRPARLMVFGRRETEADGISAIDDFSKFKGKQGVEASGTLRGELIYNEAMQLGFHILEDSEAAHVADPFGSYRKMMREGIDGPHRDLKHPLLFYTAVGIHSPDKDEIHRDLALFDPQGSTFNKI